MAGTHPPQAVTLWLPELGWAWPGCKGAARRVGMLPWDPQERGRPLKEVVWASAGSACRQGLQVTARLGLPACLPCPGRARLGSYMARLSLPGLKVVTGAARAVNSKTL